MKDSPRRATEVVDAAPVVPEHPELAVEDPEIGLPLVPSAFGVEDGVLAILGVGEQPFDGRPSALVAAAGTLIGPGNRVNTRAPSGPHRPVHAASWYGDSVTLRVRESEMRGGEPPIGSRPPVSLNTTSRSSHDRFTR